MNSLDETRDTAPPQLFNRSVQLMVVRDFLLFILFDVEEGVDRLVMNYAFMHLCRLYSILCRLFVTASRDKHTRSKLIV